VVVSKAPNLEFGFIDAVLDCVRAHKEGKRLGKYSNFTISGWYFDYIWMPDYRPHGYFFSWNKYKNRDFSSNKLMRKATVRIEDMLRWRTKRLIDQAPPVYWFPDGSVLGLREPEWLELEKDENSPQYIGTDSTELESIDFIDSSPLQREYFEARATYVRSVLENYYGHYVVCCNLGAID
jgi:hypothetical protein